MTSWTLFVGLASLLAAVWLGWRERRHPLRCVASILAIASLAAWGLPLRTKQKVFAKNAVVLLTRGYKRDSLAALRDLPVSFRDLPVFTHIEDVPPGVTLHVLGYGLDKTELSALPPVQLDFHPAPLPDGARVVTWDTQTGQGQPFTLRARIHLASRGKALLEGLGSVLDSITLTRGDTDITLRTLPKGLGRMVYTFILTEGADTLETDPVPTTIRNPIQWSILLLSSTPDFENKFLRDWLAASGHRVSTRTLISREKYDEGHTGPLAASLDSTDVVITDPAALQALPADTRARLWTRIRRDGMGLIVRADSSTTIAGLSANGVRDTIPEPVALVLDEKPLATQQIITSAYIAGRPGVQPLITDTRKNIWAARTLDGSGKVSLTTFQTAYRWMLSGDTADYAAYWSLLLEQTAGPGQPDTLVTTTPAIPRVREPVTTTILSDKDTERVSWPLKTGWQTPAGYVYAPKDWAVADAYRRQIETRAYKVPSTPATAPATALATTPTTASATALATASAMPIPGYYFLLLFLCCAGFLWAAKNTAAPGRPVKE